MPTSFYMHVDTCVLLLLVTCIYLGSTPALHTKHGSRSSTHQDSVIREKAQMARAESLDFSHRETKTGSHIEADGPQLADLIGAASMMKSCNSSLNSSTGLTNGHSAVENFSPASCKVLHYTVQLHSLTWECTCVHDLSALA